MEDEPDKNTDTKAAKARTVATTTVRPTARKEEGVIRVVQNPRKLALSARLPGHSQLILVNVYIIKMVGSDAGIYPPPLVKVGYSNDPLRRRRDLVAGNPFRLEFANKWKVCNKAAEENLAKAAVTDLKFRVSGGGTKWHKLPRGGIGGFARKVECAVNVDEYIDVNDGGGSSSRGRRRHDFLSSPINPCLAPNQEGTVMSPNNRHFNPRFPGIGNTKSAQRKCFAN